MSPNPNAACHPDDVLLFVEIAAAMRHVAKQYELPLKSITHYPMPSKGMADCKGDCCSTGDIRLVLRCAVDGVWEDEPRPPEDCWQTAAHELAHLRHMNHGEGFQEFFYEMTAAMHNRKTDHREKVLARLVKMQAARDGEAKLGNMDAAEAFAASINRMLIEYELRPSDIDYARAADDDPIVEIMTDLTKYGAEKKKARIAWQESLARIVAEAHLCTFLLRTGSNCIWFVGTRSHATVAEYVYGTLIPITTRMAINEYSKEYKRLKAAGGDLYAMRGFSAAWFDAFLSRIAERFKDARTAAVAQVVAQDLPGVQSTSLIRLDGALVKVRKYVADKFGHRRGVFALRRPRSSNVRGAECGRAAADRMVIGRKGVAAGTTPKRLNA